MNRVHEHSLFRTTVLLVALAAGGAMTQVVPSFDQVAATRDAAQKPAATSAAHESRSSGVTGIDVDMRHLNLVRSIA